MFLAFVTKNKAHHIYVINYNIFLERLSRYNNGEVKILKEKLVIKKKSLKGEDGYRTFSIRIKEETVEKLDDLAEKTNRSRNELINILLDYTIDNCEVK